MIALPTQFIEVPRAPGYFVNTKEKNVWSIKSGVLKRVAKKKPFRNHRGGYSVSVHGFKKTITDDFIEKIIEKSLKNGYVVTYSHIEE